MKKRTGSDWICVGVIFLLVGIFFYRTLAFGKLPVPSDALVGLYHPWRDLYAGEYPRGVPFKNFLITDPVRQQIPWRNLVISAYKKKTLPLWNPHNFAGTPLAANIQAAAYYPLNLLFFVFSFPAAWSFLIMLEPLLGALLMYAYLRHLSLVPEASLLGAISWAFGGFSIAWLTWGTIDHAALWLPLVLMAIDKIIELAAGKKETARRVIWMGLLVCSLVFSAFAGHAQISIYVWAVGLLYALYRVRSASGGAWRAAGILAGSAVVAILVAWVQWAPFIQFITQTGRISQPTGVFREGWFVPWHHLIQFLAPDFFGNPATLNYWGTWNYGEMIGYVGMGPLLFALYSLLGRRLRQVLFFAPVSVAALLLMTPNPLSGLPFALQIPFVSAMQPTRLMMILDFGLCVLAAAGFGEWLKVKGDKRVLFALVPPGVVIMFLWLVVLVLPNFGVWLMPSGHVGVARSNLILPTLLFVAAGVTLLAALLPSRKKFVTAASVAVFFSIMVFDLVRFGWKFTPFTDVSYFYPETKITEFLRRQQGLFRVVSLDDRIAPANTLSYYGIQTADGYDPLYFGRYEQFIAALNRGVPNTDPPYGFNRIITINNIRSPLFRLLNVRYVLSLDAVEDSAWREVMKDGKTRVYESVNTMPRIFPVESVRVVSTDAEVMQALHAQTFDPGRHAVTSEPVSVSAPLKRTDAVRIVSSDASGMKAVSSLQESHFVVVLNSFDTAWRAYIDGKPTKLYRANYAFFGVVVPEGAHEVEFRYTQI